MTIDPTILTVAAVVLPGCLAAVYPLWQIGTFLHGMRLLRHRTVDELLGMRIPRTPLPFAGYDRRQTDRLIQRIQTGLVTDPSQAVETGLRHRLVGGYELYYVEELLHLVREDMRRPRQWYER